ncbi:MAG: recombinase family protein, partial [Bacillota bacterium]|nr:recombinase family protein [Bacillota bacterium]
MASAIYLRKSRAEEDILDALQRHRDTLLEFAEKNGITVIKIYEEVVSGENLYMRPQMLKLLEDIERGAYDSVLCMDIDRLGRGNMTSQGIILDTFKNAGCVIITPRRVYDLNNELDEEYTEFETFLARREYKIITRRMRRGIVKSVQSGGHIGEVPFGYKRSFAEKLPTLEVDAEKAEFVSMAFDMYVNGGLGCQLIADSFTDAGIKPKKSDGKWARSTIRKILK